jgi:hypothetical protein
MAGTVASERPLAGITSFDAAQTSSDPLPSARFRIELTEQCAAPHLPAGGTNCTLN